MRIYAASIITLGLFLLIREHERGLHQVEFLASKILVLFHDENRWQPYFFIAVHELNSNPLKFWEYINENTCCKIILGTLAVTAFAAVLAERTPHVHMCLR